jgi:hypothetical protein
VGVECQNTLVNPVYVGGREEQKREKGKEWYKRTDHKSYYFGRIQAANYANNLPNATPSPSTGLLAETFRLDTRFVKERKSKK